MKPKKTFFRRIYDWSIQHWITSAIIPVLSSTLILFLNCFGNNFGLRDTENKLQLFIFYPALIIFILGTVFSFLKSSADRWNETSKAAAQKILGNVNTNLSYLTEYEYRRLLRFTDKYVDMGKSLKYIFKPSKQIEVILQSLRRIVSDNFGINPNMISVSILAKINGTWKKISEVNIKAGLSIEDLVTNPETTAYQIISNQQHHLFFADKAEGIETSQYVPDSLDRSCNNVGSIYCSDISMNDHKVPAVLSVATYGEQLCDAADEAVKNLLIELLFTPYEKRLQVQLGLTYILDSIDSNKPIPVS